jgi:uncharacterized protein (TIGR02145 family)
VHLNITLASYVQCPQDPNTEIIDVNRLIKQHKIQRLLLQTVPSVVILVSLLLTTWLLLPASQADTCEIPALCQTATPLAITNDALYFTLTLNKTSLVLKDSADNTSISPIASGVFASDSNTATVRTNNTTGYYLTLETTTAYSDLTHQSLPNTITPTTGDFTGTKSTLAPNTWGFTTATNPVATAAIWSQVPASGSATIIKSVDNANNTLTDSAAHDDNTTTVYYGALVTNTLPSGYYSAAIRYTAIAKPQNKPTITSVTSTTNSSNYGPINTNIPIAITGTGFLTASNVTICTPSTTFTIVSDIIITCIANSTTAGIVDTYVTNSSTLTNDNTIGDNFTYTKVPTITSLINTISTAYNTTQGNISVTTDIAANCRWALTDVTYLNMSTSNAFTTAANTAKTVTVTGLSGGTNIIYVACAHQVDGTQYSENSSTSVIISAVAPTPSITAISNSISTAYGTVQGSISVTTNIAANCRWALADIIYSSMSTDNTFVTAAGTAKTVTVSGLQGGDNTVYVSCAHPDDETKYSNNSSTSRTISVTQPIKIIADGSDIQSVTAAMCANATVFGTTSADTNIDLISKVKDSRDNHYYAIAKMPDNKCWMITNLAYGGTEAGTQFTYGAGQATSTTTTASNTDWGRRSPPYNNQKQWVSSVAPGVTTVGGTGCGGAAYRTTADSITYTECGYLYNWCAALGTAASYCNTTTSQDVPSAGTGLCPANWRLPTVNEYEILWTTKFGRTLANIAGVGSVWRGAYAGVFDPGVGLVDRGGRGEYWQAAGVTGGTLAYQAYFSLDSTTAYAWNNVPRYYGNAVRCVVNS